MEIEEVNGIELEYELVGSGEPVLLSSPAVPRGFLPLLSEPALADRHRLIRYHRRGWAGSAHTVAPVSVADHAADAGGLLDHLGVGRAHVTGHSNSGPVVLQLALDRPELVHTLTLLEPALLAVPSAGAFFKHAGPSLEAYAAGDHERAVAGFLNAVSGLDWPTCQAVIDEHVPGGVAQTVKDADTLFGIEFPAIGAWAFGPEQAAAIGQPVLSVLGSATVPLFAEGRALLHAWFPQVQDCTIEGVGHLLHIQRPQPVARAIAEFLAWNPMTAR
jgi:pimeloyl-ACP methyl ester carboxylesterase